MAKLKTRLGEAAAYTIDRFWRVIGDCLYTFTPAECVNYFAANAYRPY